MSVLETLTDEVVGLCTDADAAGAFGRAHGAGVLVAHEGEKPTRPYSALVRTGPSISDDLRAIADVGLYRATTRIIKRPDPSIQVAGPTSTRCIAAFGLVHKQGRTHAECDGHWRDIHAPLALEMHAAMCDYVQISIDEVVSGLELDGIALCAFPDRVTLSTKFFNDDDAKAAIIADVAQFSNAGGSPARVVMTQLL